MQLIENINLENTEYTPMFIEGAILAANMTPKVLAPETWIAPLVELDKQQAEASMTHHFQQQYARLMACEYDVAQLFDTEHGKNNELADFAEGFMTVWPVIENGWNEVGDLSDGTVRMLQGLLTTLMLSIDEEATQQQMIEAGIQAPPALSDLLPQLNLMISEVAKAADEALQGSKAQKINPYKDIGRNDLCVCGSGKKFKICCGSKQ
ncbi:SEC-C metal-binding domain-containing protein [Vibrio rumoiensis]|uniref:SEC-C metal-binding domain-containing protein n=1 Tax=Vibrio rumoiensis TaxID=76258 RepID=UPI003AA93114